jgi:hypothetical protein
MADLGPAGQAFHDALSSGLVKHKKAMAPLVLEAARAVDRLDDLDDIVAGKGVLELLRFRLRDDEGRVAEVRFDSILSEARQQQASLAGLLRMIAPNLDPDLGAEKGRDLLDEIAQRRSARRAGATKATGRTKRTS